MKLNPFTLHVTQLRLTIPGWFDNSASIQTPQSFTRGHTLLFTCHALLSHGHDLMSSLPNKCHWTPTHCWYLSMRTIDTKPFRTVLPCDGSCDAAAGGNNSPLLHLLVLIWIVKLVFQKSSEWKKNKSKGEGCHTMAILTSFTVELAEQLQDTHCISWNKGQD